MPQWPRVHHTGNVVVVVVVITAATVVDNINHQIVLLRPLRSSVFSYLHEGGRRKTDLGVGNQTNVT